MKKEKSKEGASKCAVPKNSLPKLVAIGKQLGMSGFGISSTMDNTPEWDSLKHLQLISAVEKAFDVKLDFDETLRMTSVKNILEVLKSRRST